MARSRFIAWPSAQAAANAASLKAVRMVASPGAAATGGGWYTLSGSGRVNFGFTVRKVDSTCASNCAYKGQLLLINTGKWWLKGNLTTYSKTSRTCCGSGPTTSAIRASIMPLVITGKLNAPVLMMARKLADCIRGRPALPPSHASHYCAAQRVEQPEQR